MVHKQNGLEVIKSNHSKTEVNRGPMVTFMIVQRLGLLFCLCDDFLGYFHICVTKGLDRSSNR